MKIKLLKAHTVDVGGKMMVKVIQKPGRKPLPLVAGAIIEASEATAKKWIKAGKAEAVTA